MDRDRPSSRIKELERLLEQPRQDRECVDQQTKLLAELVKQEIGPVLHEQITAFNPDIVIIHGGTVFNTVPGPCLTMIIDLMERHPGCRSRWKERMSGSYVGLA